MKSILVAVLTVAIAVTPVEIQLGDLLGNLLCLILPSLPICPAS
jgi:hypothetical protein